MGTNPAKWQRTMISGGVCRRDVPGSTRSSEKCSVFEVADITERLHQYRSHDCSCHTVRNVEGGAGNCCAAVDRRCRPTPLTWRPWRDSCPLVSSQRVDSI